MGGRWAGGEERGGSGGPEPDAGSRWTMLGRGCPISITAGGSEIWSQVGGEMLGWAVLLIGSEVSRWAADVSGKSQPCRKAVDRTLAMKIHQILLS